MAADLRRIYCSKGRRRTVKSSSSFNQPSLPSMRTFSQTSWGTVRVPSSVMGLFGSL